MGGWRPNAPKRLTLPLAVLAAALACTAFCKGGVAQAQGDLRCPEADAAPRLLTMHALRDSILCLVNRGREQHHRRPLHYNPDLRKSASRHSTDMVADDYFSHYGPDGSTLDQRVGRSGYLPRTDVFFVLGENIGGGVGPSYGSPVAVYRTWMHSPEHRVNILDPRFRDFGAGVARGFPSDDGIAAATYTLDFGTRH